MVGGNASRGGVSPANASAGTRLFSIPLAKPSLPGLAGPQRKAIENALAGQATNGQTLGVLPVTDRGELFFQDGQRVYAVSLDSGLPLPGWAKSYGGDRNGQYVLPNVSGMSRGAQQSLTLTDRYVLGVMGQMDRQLMMMFGMQPQGEPRLVCLDRATGREQWVVALSTADAVPKNDDEKTVRSLQMSGSPLVVGDNVLVIGRSLKPGQGEDCYVLAFDLNNGRYRWGTYVASSGAAPGAMYGMQQAAGENTSHLAYANGRVYVLTNLGALAALDAYSGTIAWLNIYPLDRPEVPFRGGFNPMWMGGQATANQGRFKPWMYNPVVVQDGQLFMLPTEGKYLIVYDAGTGRETKRINLEQLSRWNPKADKQPDKPTTLVGVNGNRLVLAGESRVLCVDWRKYDEESFPGPDDDMILWPSLVPGSIRGRAFMTAKSLYLPADDKLRRLDLETGSATEEYPKYPRVWEDGEAPGNVLVTGDHVVLAGAASVDVYTDLNAARQKLDREIAAAPTDPDARLRYAEVMFVAGQTDAALRRLDEAIELLGGLARMQPGPSRDRVFNDALTFAQKTAAEERPEKAQRVEALFDRAAAAASAPQQHVHYRMARAKFAADARKDPAAALRLYQEVLADAGTRAVSLMDEAAGNPSQAEDVVERAVDQLIKAHGPGLYAPYQAQAAKALAEARAEAAVDAKAAKLQAVAQAYPNSGIAPEAMLAAADAFEAAKQPRSTIRVLRQMWFKYQQSPNRAAILEGLARNYLAVSDRNRAEMVSTAAARLAQAAQLPGDPKLTRPLALPDGKVVAAAGTTFEQALNEVRKISGTEAGRTLSDFRLKVPTLEERGSPRKYPKAFAGQAKGAVASSAEARALDGATLLVLPARDFARADRVVAWSPAGGLSIYAAGQTQPLATNRGFAVPALAAPAAGAGGAGDAAAAARPLVLAEALAAGAPRGVAWAGDAALVWAGGRLASVDAASGKTSWEIDFTRLPTLEVVRVNDGQVPMAGGGDPNVVNPNMPIAINGRFNGRVIRGGGMVVQGGMVVGAAAADARVRPATGGSPAQPVLPDAAGGEQVADVRPVGDRVLVTTSAGRLLAADLATGRVAWQARLADRTPDRLAATEDFTVVKVNDDAIARLFALDTFSGRLLGSRGFPVAGNTALVNLALSADGTLVYTMPDRLCLRDLYKPWADDEKVVAGQPGQPLYAGATLPGQLLIAEGRILAVADSGGSGNAFPGMLPNEKYVRVHSLETGQPLQLKYDAPGDGGKRQIDRLLQAGTKDWNVMLRTVGPHLYVVGPQSIYGYNLDNPAETWKGMTNLLSTGGGAGAGGQSDVNFRDAFIGQTHVVVLDQPPPAADGDPARYRLHAFGRYQLDESGALQGESGRLDYNVTVTDPAGIAPQWQAADTGFYYATADGKVRMLLGARQDNAPRAAADDNKD